MKLEKLQDKDQHIKTHCISIYVEYDTVQSLQKIINT